MPATPDPNACGNYDPVQGSCIDENPRAPWLWCGACRAFMAAALASTTPAPVPADVHAAAHEAFIEEAKRRWFGYDGSCLLDCESKVPREKCATCFVHGLIASLRAGAVTDEEVEVAQEAMALVEKLPALPWTLRPDHEERDHAHVDCADGEICRVDEVLFNYEGSKAQADEADRRLSAIPAFVIRAHTLLTLLARAVLARPASEAVRVEGVVIEINGGSRPLPDGMECSVLVAYPRAVGLRLNDRVAAVALPATGTKEGKQS